MNQPYVNAFISRLLVLFHQYVVCLDYHKFFIGLDIESLPPLIFFFDDPHFHMNLKIDFFVSRELCIVRFALYLQVVSNNVLVSQKCCNTVPLTRMVCRNSRILYSSSSHQKSKIKVSLDWAVSEGSGKNLFHAFSGLHI